MIKSSFHAFGRNSAVAASFEDIWSYGGAHTEIVTSAAMHISSSSASDTTDVTIVGLDADYALQSVTETLVGQTETTVGAETWIRVFGISNVGATDFVGDVYCYLDDTVTAGVPQTASKVQAKIAIGYGQSLTARWTVPAGSTAYLESFYGFASTAAATEINLMYKAYGVAAQVVRTIDINANGGKIVFEHPLVCTEKSDIYIRAKAGGVVTAGIEGYYTT